MIRFLFSLFVVAGVYGLVSGCAVQSEMVEVDESMTHLLERQKEVDAQLTRVEEVANRLHAITLRMDAVEERLDEEGKVALQRELIDTLDATSQDRDAIKKRQKTMEEYFVRKLAEYADREKELLEQVAALQTRGEEWMAKLGETGSQVERLEQVESRTAQLVQELERERETLQRFAAVVTALRKTQGDDDERLGQLAKAVDARIAETGRRLAALAEVQKKQGERMSAFANAVNQQFVSTGQRVQQSVEDLTGRMGTADAELARRLAEFETARKESERTLQEALAALAARTEQADGTLQAGIDTVAESQAAASAHTAAEVERLTRLLVEAEGRLAEALKASRQEDEQRLATVSGSLSRRLQDTDTRITVLMRESSGTDQQISRQVAALEQRQAEEAEQAGQLEERVSGLAEQSVRGDEALTERMQEADSRIAALTRESAGADDRIAGEIAALNKRQAQAAELAAGRAQAAEKRLAEVAGQSSRGDEVLTERLHEADERLAALARESAGTDKRIAGEIAALDKRQAETAAEATRRAKGLETQLAEVAGQSARGDELLAEQVRASGERLAALARESAGTDKRIAGEIAALDKRQADAAQLAAQRGTELDKKLAAVAEQAARGDEATAMARALEAQIAEASRRMASLDEQLQRVEETPLGSAAGRIDTLETGLSRLREAVDGIQTQAAALDKRQADAAQLAAQRGAELDKKLAEVAGQAARGDEATAMARALEAQIAEASRRMSSLDEQLNRVEETPLGSAAGRIDTLETGLAGLSERLAALSGRQAEADKRAALQEQELGRKIETVARETAQGDEAVAQRLSALERGQEMAGEEADKMARALTAQLAEAARRMEEMGRQLEAAQTAAPGTSGAGDARRVARLEQQVALLREAVAGGSGQSGDAGQLRSRLAALDETARSVDELAARLARIEERETQIDRFSQLTEQLALMGEKVTEQLDLQAADFQRIAIRLDTLETGLHAFERAPPAWGAALDRKVTYVAEELTPRVDDLAAELNETLTKEKADSLGGRINALGSELVERLADVERQVRHLEAGGEGDSSGEIARVEDKMTALGEEMTRGTDVLADSLAVLWERVVTLEAIQKADSSELRKRVSSITERLGRVSSAQPVP